MRIKLPQPRRIGFNSLSVSLSLSMPAGIFGQLQWSSSQSPSTPAGARYLLTSNSATINQCNVLQHFVWRKCVSELDDCSMEAEGHDKHKFSRPALPNRNLLAICAIFIYLCIFLFTVFLYFFFLPFLFGFNWP